jgi:hypothetical protein
MAVLIGMAELYAVSLAPIIVAAWLGICGKLVA